MKTCFFKSKYIKKELDEKIAYFIISSSNI